MNDALAATELQPDECAYVLNRDYSEVPEGAQRSGYTKHHHTRFKNGSSTAFEMLGLTSFGYDFASGAQAFRDIFVGIADGTPELRYVSGGTGTQVSFSAGVSVGTEAWPFSFANVGNRLLGTNGDMNFSWNGDTGRAAQSIGVEAPNAAPSVATGGAGSNLTGDYRWLVVYKDSTDDVRGAASAASTSTAFTADAASLSSIPVSTNPRVSHKEIYRTKNRGQAPYFLVTTITNATTTYVDNVADTALTTELDAGGQLPACRILAPYNGVLYGLNNPSGDNYSTAYPSLPGRWEEFLASDAFEIGGADGQQITGAYVVRNQLIVFRESSIFHVTGTSKRNRNVQEINSAVGMRWPFAGVQVGDQILFAGQSGFYVYDSATVTKLENLQEVFPLQGTYDGIGNLSATENFGEEMRVFWLAARQQLLASYRSSANAGPNTDCMVWNKQATRKPWALYDFGFDVIGEWRDNYSNVPTPVFATEDADGWVFELDEGYTDRCDSAGTLTGTATAGDATSLTDSAAGFDTTGEGLIDVEVWVKQASTDTTQVATITTNTGTKVSVASWPTFTPVAGDTYAIGSIGEEFKTGRLDFDVPEMDKELLEVEIRLGSVA